MKLASSQYKGLRVRGVRGYQLDVVDPRGLRSLPFYEEGDYAEELRSLWVSVYRRYHPNDANGRMAVVAVYDTNGGMIFGISTPSCAMP